MARIIWVSCLFLELIIILIMVMDYKIHYQYLTYNKLYFYECNGILCVSEVADDKKLMYSYYSCGYEECPAFIKNALDQYAILKDKNKTILYDYQNNRIISQDYDDYEFIMDDYIIVQKNQLYGIINLQNKKIIEPLYEEIGDHKDGTLIGYNFSNVIAKKEDKYGIISFKDGKIIEEFKYTNDEAKKVLEKLKLDNQEN